MSKIRVSMKQIAAATAWQNLWKKVAERNGATSVNVRDIRDLKAVFRTDRDAEEATDDFMGAGFAVACGDRSVDGFPDCIQDDVTGEPTNSGLRMP